MLIFFEAIIGYSIFFCKEELLDNLFIDKFQNNINNYDIFSKNFKLKAFAPFRSINHSLKECLKITESSSSDFMEKFILNFFNSSKKNKELGIFDPKLAIHLNKSIKKKFLSNMEIFELGRGIRLHFERISKNFFFREIYKAQCGIAHLYSQSKMRLNLEKTDSMITQSNFLLEQLESDLNFFTMLCKEWYSWHFPELINIIKDGYLFALVTKLIGDRRSINIRKTKEIALLAINQFTCKEIQDSSKVSIGSFIENCDLSVIEKLCSIIINLTEFKNYVEFSLHKKVTALSPNLNQIIGENQAVKLISKAGSLKNLTRFPASTIQILGSEKALFKALKNRIKTPKYGILFNSSILRGVDNNNQAKFSRYLANKCSLAVRIDYFSNFSTDIYGRALKQKLLMNIKKGK